jgi:pseudouridine-5'-monophosphatase
LPIPIEEFQAKVKLLQAKHFPSTQPLPGAPELLSTLSNTKTPQVHMALATSSHYDNFVLKTTHLEPLFAVFEQQHRVLGDDVRIPKGRGKPAPDIYLLALKTVNDKLKSLGEPEVYPEECLVFEDSVPGVEAGRRAGMQVLWCPHEGLLGEYKGREREVLAGLMGEHKGDDGAAVAEAVAKDETRPFKRAAGAPGTLDDGWAVFVKSLADFPYEWFGIEKGNSSL